MHRRTFLGVALSPFLVAPGCLQSGGPTNDPSDQNSSDADSPSETDEPTTDEQRKDPLFVHNYRSEGVNLRLIVESSGSDGRIVDSDYRIPGRHGARIPAIGKFGKSYEITVTAFDSTWEDSWSPVSCEREIEGNPNPSRQHTPRSIVVPNPSEDEPNLYFRTSSCDVDPMHSDLSYEHHENFQLE